MEVKNTNQVISTPNGKIDSKIIEKNSKSTTAQQSGDIATRQKSADYSVGISSNAQEVKASHQRAFEIAKNTSPIRAERVAELKAQIQNGTYKIDSGKIADGMLREAIKDELSTGL